MVVARPPLLLLLLLLLVVFVGVAVRASAPPVFYHAPTAAVQYGSSGDDEAFSLVANANGTALFLTGTTWGNLDGQPSHGNADAFVTKLDAASLDVLWTRLLGTNFADYGSASAVCGDELFVVGSSTLVGGFTDAFVTKMSVIDGAVAWTARLGTAESSNSASAVACHGAGAVLVVGATDGNMSSLTANAGGTDAFAALVRASDGAVHWTALLGTQAADYAYGVAVGGAGAPLFSVVTGTTWGNLSGPSAGQSDAFVAKLTSDGAVAWVRQLGTPAVDEGKSVAVAGEFVYVCGSTGGALGAQASRGGVDAYVVALNVADGSVKWTRQFGTPSVDSSNHIIYSGHILYVAGTESVPSAPNGLAALVGALDARDGTPLWFDSIDTSADDNGLAVVAGLAEPGTLFVGGHTRGSLSSGSVNAGGYDVFVSKWAMSVAALSVDFPPVMTPGGGGGASSISFKLWPPLPFDVTVRLQAADPTTSSVHDLMPAVPVSFALASGASGAAFALTPKYWLCDALIDSELAVTFAGGQPYLVAVPYPPRVFIRVHDEAECVTCERGEFANVTNITAVHCSACAPLLFQTFSAAKTTRCRHCVAATYKSTPDPTQDDCRVCPTNVYCPPGSPPLAEDGFWLVRERGAGAVRAVECPPNFCRRASVCFPGCASIAEPCVDVPAQQFAPLSCCDENRVEAADNPLCGRCKPGYSQWTGQCLPCDAVQPGMLLALALLGLFVLQVTTRFSGGAKLKILVVFLQTLHAATASDPTYPSFLGAVASFSPLGATTKCAIPVDGLDLVMLPFYEVSVTLLLLIVVFIANVVAWTIHRQRAPRLPPLKTSPFRRVALAVVVLSFIPIVRATVLLSRCVDVGDGRRVLWIQPSVDCDGASFRAAKAVAIAATVALVAFLVVFVVFFGHGRYMRYCSADAPHDRTLRKFIDERFGFLFLPYRGDSALTASWEAVMMARNAILVVIIATEAEWRTRFSLVVVASGVSMLVQLAVQPYAKQEDNVLEGVALFLINLIAALNTSRWFETDTVRALTLALTYGLPCATFAAVAWQFWASGELQKRTSRAVERLSDAHDRRVTCWSLLIGCLCWYAPRRAPDDKDDAHLPLEAVPARRLDARLLDDYGGEL